METHARLTFKVQNLASDVADIDIFDVIGDSWEGTTAKDFVTQLRAIKSPNINLHINSPGGYVSDGLAMYNALQQHPSTITAYIESEAASAASFVAMAADKIVIARTARMMIHDAQGFAIGNAADMRSLAAELDEQSQNIASIYAEHTGQTSGDWRAAMQANDGMGTFYRGQEAVDAGLADELMPAPPKAKTPSSNSRAPHSRQPMRAMAKATNQAETTTIGACITICAADALTDMAQELLELNLVSMDEFTAVSNLITEQVAALNAGLEALGFADRVIPSMDEDDDEAMDMVDLIPPLANGYKPPLPSDFTRLVAANLPASTKGA